MARFVGRVAVALIVILGMTARSDADNPPPSPLELVASPQRLAFGAGEPVDVTLTFTNVGHADEFITVRDPIMDFDILVLNAREDEVPKTVFGVYVDKTREHMPTSVKYIKLKPGESYKAAVRVSVVRDMTMYGVYEIRVRYEPLQPPDTPGFHSAVADPMRVRIKPTDAKVPPASGPTTRPS